MPRDEHNKAAEHHENAAKSHRAAAEQHGKGDHAKGKEHSANAQQHSQNARQQSDQAHSRVSSRSKPEDRCCSDLLQSHARGKRIRPAQTLASDFMFGLEAKFPIINPG